MSRHTTASSPLGPHGTTPRHRNPIGDGSRHDLYQAKGKYEEPTVCTGCNAVYQHGRWVRAARPDGAHAAECPACHRIRDNEPAGYLSFKGSAVVDHYEAFVQLIRNVEKHENAEHPLNRIVDIAQKGDELLVTTTDVHLPQRIGEAVRHAYHGHLDISYGEDEYVVRVHWRS